MPIIRNFYRNPTTFTLFEVSSSDKHFPLSEEKIQLPHEFPEDLREFSSNTYGHTVKIDTNKSYKSRKLSHSETYSVSLTHLSECANGDCKALHIELKH